MARTSLGSYGSAYAPDEDEEEKRARALEAFQQFRQPEQIEPDLPMGKLPTQAEATEAAKPAPLGAGHVRPEREVAPEGHGGESTGGWDEGTKDATMAALAGFLDILGNKGRGVGSILQASSQQASARARAKERAKKDSQDYQLSAQRQLAERSNSERRFEGEDADRKLRTSQQELERERALEIHQRWREQNDPNNPMNQADLEYRQALTEEAKARAARDPNAITPYQQAQLDAQKDERGERGQDRDEDRAWRQQQHATDIADKQAAREAAAAERAEAAAARQEQKDIANGMRADIASQKAAEAYTKQYEYELKAMGPLMRAEAIADKHKGKDIPGVGMLDSRMPMWAREGDSLEMGNAQEWMSNLVQRAESGAAAPIPEALGYRVRAGMQDGATEAQFADGIKAMNEYVRGSLRAGTVGRSKEAREALDLQARGGGNWALGPEEQPAAAAPIDITDQLGKPGPVITPGQQSAVELPPDPAFDQPPQPIRLGPTGGPAPRSVNPLTPRNGGTDGSELLPPGMSRDQLDVLPTTGQKRGQVTEVSEHLRRLQEEDDDLGVSYR
jgi:hypothetical protein